MKHRLMGVDPGKKGGIAILDMETGKPVAHYKMKIGEDGKVDVRWLWDVMDRHNVMYVTIEMQYISPNQGHSMVIGENYGRITGLVDSFVVIDTLFVSSNEWHKGMFKTKKGEYDKEIAVRWCEENKFPVPRMGKTKQSKKPHDGVAEAWCIGTYGRRHFLAELKKRRSKESNIETESSRS